MVERKIWVDQIVERPRTYNLVENLDGTVTLHPSFGDIIVDGTPINAENMNHIYDYIDSKFSELNNIIENEVNLKYIDIMSLLEDRIEDEVNDVRTEFDGKLDNRHLNILDSLQAQLNNIREDLAGRTDSKYLDLLMILEGRIEDLEYYVDTEIAKIIGEPDILEVIDSYVENDMINLVFSRDLTESDIDNIRCSFRVIGYNVTFGTFGQLIDSNILGFGLCGLYNTEYEVTVRDLRNFNILYSDNILIEDKDFDLQSLPTAIVSKFYNEINNVLVVTFDKDFPVGFETYRIFAINHTIDYSLCECINIEGSNATFQLDEGISGINNIEVMIEYAYSFDIIEIDVGE